ADANADETPAPEHREGHRRGVAAALEEDDPLLRRQPVVVGVRGAEERRAGGGVVAAAGVLAGRAGEAGLTRQHESMWIAARELTPSHDPGRELAERGAGVATDECLAAELLPPRLALAVVHDQIGVAQVAGGPEREDAPLHAAVERDRRVAERAEGDRDGG